MAYVVAVTMSPSSAAPNYSGSPWISGVLQGGEDIERNRLASVGMLREEVDLSRGGNLSQVSSTEIGFALQAGEWEAMVAANATAVGGRVVCYLNGIARWWGEVVDEEFTSGILRLSCESPTMRLQNQQAPAVAYDIEGYPQMRQDDTGLAGPMVYGYCTESRVIGDRWDDQTPYATTTMASLISTLYPVGTPTNPNNHGVARGFEQGREWWTVHTDSVVVSKEASNVLKIAHSIRSRKESGSASSPFWTDSEGGEIEFRMVPGATGIIVARSGAIGASTAFSVPDAGGLATYPAVWPLTPYSQYRVFSVQVNTGFYDAISVGDSVAVSDVQLGATVADRDIVVTGLPYQIKDRRILSLSGWSQDAPRTVLRAPGWTAEQEALGSEVPVRYIGTDCLWEASGVNANAPMALATAQILDAGDNLPQARISVSFSIGGPGTEIRLVGNTCLRLECEIQKQSGDVFDLTTEWSTDGTITQTVLGEYQFWICGAQAYASQDDIPVGATLTGVISHYRAQTDIAATASIVQTITLVSYQLRTWNAATPASDAIGDDSGPVLVDLTGPVIVDAIAGDAAMPVGAVIRTAPDIVRDILRTRTDGSILPSDASILLARDALEIASGEGLEAIRCALSTTEQAPVSDWLVSLASDWGMVLSPSTIPGVMDVRTPWASWGAAVEHTILPGEVVQDSTQGLGMTDLRDLINQPVFKFHFSEASKYRRSARIQRIDADPSEVTPTTVPGYASGFPNPAIAQTAWGVCHDSRTKYGLTRQDEIELRTVPDGSLWGAIGAASPALSRIEWLASRKRTIALEVHESHSAAFAALGALVSVRHKRYLTSASRGVVVAREWDPVGRTSRLSIMLAPSQLESEIGAEILIDTLDPDADTLVDTLNATADTVVDTLEI